MIKNISCLFFIFILGLVHLNAQVTNELVPVQQTYYSNYKFLHPELNMLQFYSRDAMDHFYQKWKNTDREKLTVLHFGDSHCQHEAFPGQIRKRLQELHGDAGRGLMFPYSTANTYNSIEYTTSHTGRWSYEKGYTVIPKLPMGVRGMTCRTEQTPASFNFSFVSNVPEHYTLLKIFCKQSANSYDINIEIDGNVTAVTIDDKNPEPFITVKIPAIKNRKMSISVVKNNPEESEFEFYGMSLESERNNGVIYHNAGIGAARFCALLYYGLLWQHIPYFQPDVIVLDYGTNDYLYDDIIRPELEKEIKTIISKMRAAAPNATIILTSSQDLFYKKRNCRSGIPFSDLIHRIAAETKCAVFDWFWISGGQGTMHNWVKEGIAQPDYVHLSVRGYQLKGDLFFEAIKNTMTWLDRNQTGEEFFFNVDSLKKLATVVQPVVASPVQNNTNTKVNPAVAANTKTAVKTIPKTTPVPASSTAGRVKYVHKITTGESLYSIAKKYNVTIAQLKSWNNLRSDLINAGKTLNVWVLKRK
jgi:LysM repeat protein/lysophospholipase L1-like esterase